MWVIYVIFYICVMSNVQIQKKRHESSYMIQPKRRRTTFQLHDGRPLAVNQAKLACLIQLMPKVEQKTDDGFSAKDYYEEIVDVIEKSALKKYNFIKFDSPPFLEDEIAGKSKEELASNIGNIQCAKGRYLEIINKLDNSIGMKKFIEIKKGANNTFEKVTAHVEKMERVQEQINKDLGIPHFMDLCQDDAVTNLRRSCMRMIFDLVDECIKDQGIFLEKHFADGGERNRGAGPEVDAVNQIFASGMVEVGPVNSVYKSPYDIGPGRLGCEWLVKEVCLPHFVRSKSKLSDIAKKWVLHSHVENVKGSRYSREIERNVNAHDFHFKEKKTASGAFGPSVKVVDDRFLKTPAEENLIIYLGKAKRADFSSWIKKQYIIDTSK